MESDSLTLAWAAALDAVPTDELGPVATSMLRYARPLGDIEGTILLAVPTISPSSGLKIRRSRS